MTTIRIDVTASSTIAADDDDDDDDDNKRHHHDDNFYQLELKNIKFRTYALNNTIRNNKKIFFF
jgi:hypothetical protein